MAAIALLLGCLWIPVSIRAQSAAACPALPLPPGVASGVASGNLLSPEQEEEFARIYIDTLAWNRRPFIGPSISRYPTAVLRRLLKGVPAGAGLHPRILFYDGASPDAFVTPGGHVYISRQMAPFLHGESELAALLAHEMGHALMHQSAVEFSQKARQMLGITHFADDWSVLDAYSRITDLRSSNLKELERENKEAAKREKGGQESADQIALSLLMAAGYPPQAMADMFNRLAQAHGHTGNWLGDLFRTTSNAEFRLRGMEKSLDRLPDACRRRKPPFPVGDFAAWRAAVISFEPAPGPSSLSGVVVSGRLRPAMPGSVRRVRFSPGGRYVLLQNSSGLFIYTSNPLKLDFSIHVPDAAFAGFSPDGRSVIFHTVGLRVERWDLRTRKRVSVHLVGPLDHCWGERDSPDGRYMAVLSCDGNLSILDETTGAKVFSRKGNGGWNGADFSSDGRYFLALSNGPNGPTAVDLTRKHRISLPNRLKLLLAMSLSFRFLDATQLAVVSESDGGVEIDAVQFPGGEGLGGVRLYTPDKGGHDSGRVHFSADGPSYGFPTRVGRVTGSKGVLVFPYGRYAAALLDWSHKKRLVLFPSAQVDVFGQYAAVRQGGRLRVDDLKAHRILSAVDLPPGLLDSVSASAVSPDLKWLAISGPHEGAIYRLTDGRVMDEMRAFTHVWFGAANAVYADQAAEPGLGGKRATRRASIETRINLENSAPPFHLKLADGQKPHGRYLISTHVPETHGDFPKKVTLEVRSLPANKLLWSRTMPWPGPDVSVQPDGKTLLLGWSLMPKFPGWLLHGLNKRYEKLRKFLGVDKKETGHVFRLVDAETGNIRTHFLLPGLMATVGLRSEWATGVYLVVSDDAGRTRAFSLQTSHQEGLALGRVLAVSPAAPLVCIGESPRLLHVARLPSLRSTSSLKFAQPVAVAQFSHDGRRLFVLTRDQRYFLFDVGTLVGRPGKPVAR